MANKEFEDIMRDSEAFLEKTKAAASRGLEEDYVIFHWNEAARTWDQKSWQDWMWFMGCGEVMNLGGEPGEKFRPLQGIGEGEHYFVVCIVDEDRILYNINPHRYFIDKDRRIIDSGYFGVLSEDETKRYEALDKRHHQYPQIRPMNDKEQAEFDAIRDRLWHSWLPPKEAAMVLIRNLPGFPKVDRPCLKFLAAFGMSDQTGAAN